jgi:diguanylate cyclase (GGDEF)-like protein/PAS domain S-box-containing protein
VPFRTEFRFQRKDGSVVWTRVNSAAMRDGMALHGHVQTVEDITERKSTEFGLRAAEEALFEEKERAQVTLNSIGDAVLTTDMLGNVTYLNLEAEAMTGWSREDALGRPLAEVFRIIDGTTRQTVANPAQHALAEDMTVGLAADCVLIRRDGFESAIEDSAAPIHNRSGQVTGAVIVFHDVSQSRAMAQKMAHLAQHDFLTDLPNRAQLMERLSQAIGLANRHRKQVALLFLDLDDFKHINDSLGHAIGDQLLQSVADRLVSCVRSTDMVCRQGGDEFVILLAEIEQPQDAGHVAETLLAAFFEPHLIGGLELHVTLSIGISVYPDDGGNVDSVMQNADTAMFHAKASGHNNYQFFRADMNIRAVRRLAVETSLRRALKEGEFLLHYQPKIDLDSGAITGAEALIRWLDPDLGLIQPAQFIPVAEACGLIVPIGRWVLREACRQVRAWLDSGLRAVPVAVNISAEEFRHKGFLDGVALMLQETSLAPSYLELELTESILMHDADSSALVLDALKAMGVRLAIDDFGTGYSSLSYLKRFPIDTLKIDQSFVRDIATDADDATIVSAVIGMGKNLKQRVVAEGVETHEQLEFLRAQQCHEGQGFYFSHALSADAFGLQLKCGKR